MIQKTNNFSLPVRIIFNMLLILLFTAGSILLITANHFNNQTERYHEDILKRKESAVLALIDYELDKYPGDATEDNIHPILENKLLEISDINKLHIVIYDLRGNKMLTTEVEKASYEVLPQAILDKLQKSDEFIIMHKDSDDASGSKVYSSFSYIKNYNGENVAILNLPYQTNDVFLQEDMFTLLGSYGLAFGIILLVGTIAVYIVTKRTLVKLWSFADLIRDTGMIANNSPILYEGKDEIKVLVDSYNTMLLKLKEQSRLIAQIEREEAWRDFARQVAHEIKNPLTPMKLMIQNQMRKFDVTDENLKEKTMRTGKILLQQIDTIAAIAEAFSDFAKMPTRRDEKINIVEIIKNALYIFPKDIVHFEYKQPEIMMYFDKQYLNRVINNVTKNALQSVPSDRKANIRVAIELKDNFVYLTVQDNGKGIPEEIQPVIFNPKFTTKNSGMGIGLPMVKKILEDYDGTIQFESIENKGTTFTMQIPYNA